MVKNYKLALIGLIVSCSLLNAMDQQAYSHEIKLNQLSNEELMWQLSCLSNATKQNNRKRKRPQDACKIRNAKERKKRKKRTEFFEILRDLVGGKTREDVLQRTATELSMLKTKNLPNSKLVRRNQKLNEINNKLVRCNKEQDQKLQKLEQENKTKKLEIIELTNHNIYLRNNVYLRYDGILFKRQ